MLSDAHNGLEVPGFQGSGKIKSIKQEEIEWGDITEVLTCDYVVVVVFS